MTKIRIISIILARKVTINAKTGKEMVKLALANGWIEVRKRGSHHHFKKEGVSYLVTIPVHGNEDLGKGLERKILKDLGL